MSIDWHWDKNDVVLNSGEFSIGHFLEATSERDLVDAAKRVTSALRDCGHDVNRRRTWIYYPSMPALDMLQALKSAGISWATFTTPTRFTRWRFVVNRTPPDPER